jgi:hypothetical protein
MAIEFACGSCGRRYKVAESLAGKRGPCQSCGRVIEVPRPGGADLDIYGLDEAAAATAEPEALRRPAAKPRSRSSGASAANREDRDPNSWPFANGVEAIIGGAIVMVAPGLLGRRFAVLNRFPPAAKLTMGLILLLGGVVSIGLELARVPRTVRTAVEYAIGGLAVLVFFVGFALPGPSSPGKFFFAGVKTATMDPQHPDFSTLQRPPSRPSVTTRPAPEGESVVLTISEGKARPVQGHGPFVTYEFEVKFRFERGRLDPARPFRWLVYSSKFHRQYAFPTIDPDVGTLKKTDTILDAGYGPFEAVLGYEEAPGEIIGGQPFHRLSNTISLDLQGEN